MVLDISTSFILLTCSACLCFTLFPSIYHWLSVVYYKIPGFDLYMILSISNCLFLRFMFLGFFFILFIPFLFSEHFTFSLRLLMRVMLETTHIEISFCFSSISKQLQNTKQNLAKNAEQFQLIFFLNFYVFLPLSEINRKQPVMVTLIVHEFFHWPCFVLLQDYLT